MARSPRSNQHISSLRPHFPSLFVFSSIEISTDTTTSAAPSKETSARTCASIGWALSDWNHLVFDPMSGRGNTSRCHWRWNEQFDRFGSSGQSFQQCLHAFQPGTYSSFPWTQQRHVAAKRGGRFFAERILCRDPSLVWRRKHRMGELTVAHRGDGCLHEDRRLVGDIHLLGPDYWRMFPSPVSSRNRVGLSEGKSFILEGEAGRSPIDGEIPSKERTRFDSMIFFQMRIVAGSSSLLRMGSTDRNVRRWESICSKREKRREEKRRRSGQMS